MRRRLLVVYMSLFALTLAALTVPFATTLVARESQAVFIAQQRDTVRFASVAASSLPRGRTTHLQAELTRYRQLFDVDAAVLDQNGRLVIASQPSWSPDRVLVDRGLSGNRSESGLILWPWTNHHLQIVEPVVRGGEVVGVVVTSGATPRLKARLTQRLGVLALLCVLALSLTWLAVNSMTKWILRPVRDLDTVTHEIAAGRLHSRVARSTGPPELRRLADSFNTMANTVTRTLDRQRAFVSQASHQLRNPLGTLRLRVENLDEHLTPSGAREHELTLDELTRLVRTLDGLLELARTEEGRPDLTTVDADRTIEARVAAWRPLAESLGLSLRRAGTIGHPVRSVPEGVDQVLDALIDNALKFGAGEVAVHAAPSGLMAEIRVIDDGPGLSEHDRSRAAERFWRGVSHQNVEGSGLGLSIVQMLAEMSDGSLALLPREPHGLDARVRLPLVL